MSEFVFILGAGASVSSGAPVMNNFLERAEKLYRTGKLREYSSHFDRVFETISEMQSIHSKSEMDINNIETVYALLEMAKVIGGYKDKSIEDIQAVIDSLKILIQVTLEKSIRYGWNTNNYFVPIHDYHNFCQLLSEKFGTRSKQFSIITYNYDVALDFALTYHKFEYNYSIEDKEESNNISLLKLHGSLNWFKCSTCGKIIPFNDFNSFKAEQHIAHPNQTSDKSMEISKSDPSILSHCGHEISSDNPWIVPPTWNKTDYHTTLSNVWSKAAKELSDAEHIFIIGYSLPESDYFFKFLYSLGTLGSSIIKGIYIINPDEQVDPNYKNMISNFTGKRIKFYHKVFGLSLDEIRKAINNIQLLVSYYD